jgi:hypothetical protein
MKKITLFCAALLLTVSAVMGQKSYSDIYKSLGTMKDFDAYRTLFQYLLTSTSKDYQNSNAYYHIGRYYQKFMSETDPFNDIENIQDFIRQANIYYTLAKRSLDNRDFKMHMEFYPNIKRKEMVLSMSDVFTDIDERIAYINEYKERLEQSLLYLVKSVSFYNYCITVFGEINQENNRLNDLYFLVDDNLQNKLDMLNTSFDSTLYYLDKLKVALEEYPLGEYKINYSLQPIPVYRLYGLNSADFLSKNAELWDFHLWLQSFNEVRNSDVAFLYGSAQEVNETNSGCIRNLLDMNIDTISPNYKINPLIVNKMLKYDFNSATAALLSYQEAKVNYLYSIADGKAERNIVSFDKFAKTSDAFLNTVKQKQKTDELLTFAKAKATPESTKKYAKFYENNYGGHSGHENYLKSETERNETALNTVMNEYKERALQSYIHTGAEKAIAYNGRPVYLQITAPTSITGDGYYIHSKSALADQSILIAGTFTRDKQKTAFAALVDSIGAVKWLRDLGQANTVSHAMLTAITNEGFAVVVSTPKTDNVSNKIHLLDAKGNIRTSKDLTITAVPQKMIYDDIAQNFVIAFKGNTFMPFLVSEDVCQICMLNEKLVPVWNKSLTFEGYVANVVKTDDNYYLYGAYSKVTDENGKTYSTVSNRINMFVYPVNARGEWLSVTLFEAPFSYSPLHVSKINNEYVDIIAVKDLRADRLIEDKTTNGTSYYMIIHSNNKLFYQYTGK